MRNLFYSSLFILLLSVSLLVVTFFLRPQKLQITVTEPLHIEKKETARTYPVPQEKKTIPEISDAIQRPHDRTEAVPKKTAASDIQEKKDISLKVHDEKKIFKPEQTALPQKKSEKKKSREPPVSADITANHVENQQTNIPYAKSENKPVKKKKVEYKCGWIEDFEPDGHLNGDKYVDNWRREGGVIFTPKTRFYLKKDTTASLDSVLVIESRKSSAVFACDLSDVVDLNRTPVLRWRWKVKKLPPFGDGRHKKKDDQAVGIYIGSGTAFNQKAISYRWETETPVGHWGKTLYSNVMNVWFYCLRNKHSGLDVWYEECRNVRKDFLDKYGYVPDKIALVICGNSQNSKSDALAEIDYIGFYKEIK